MLLGELERGAPLEQVRPERGAATPVLGLEAMVPDALEQVAEAGDERVLFDARDGRAVAERGCLAAELLDHHAFGLAAHLLEQRLDELGLGLPGLCARARTRIVRSVQPAARLRRACPLPST